MNEITKVVDIPYQHYIKWNSLGSNTLTNFNYKIFKFRNLKIEYNYFCFGRGEGGLFKTGVRVPPFLKPKKRGN